MYKFNCLECGTSFEAKDKSRKFCKQSCSARNAGKLKSLKRKEEKLLLPKEEKYCQFCKILLNHSNKTYCNNSCQQNYIKSKRTEEDLLKLSNQALRRHLIKLHGDKCMKCGWCQVHPVTNTVPIELNHVDGNAENKAASNLELICPNCHSLTPNYRGLNKGNGRSKRMERYYQGKTW